VADAVIEAQEPKVFFGHRGEIRGVNFNAGGTVLASASFDFTIKLWNMDGQELKTFKGHGYNLDTGAVYSISFSPDGMSLVSAGADRQIILWNLNLDNLLEYGCSSLQDYLRTNPSNKNNRYICNGIQL
jgi:WD40 repeat protein